MKLYVNVDSVTRKQLTGVGGEERLGVAFQAGDQYSPYMVRAFFRVTSNGGYILDIRPIDEEITVQINGKDV